MTSKFRTSLLIATISLLFTSGTASFPANSQPISVSGIHDVSSSFFAGGEQPTHSLRYTQDLKIIQVAGTEYFVITGREKLFLVRPEDFSPSASTKVPYTEVYSWKTDDKAKNLCVLKGISQENCDNYIRVVEQMDDNGNKLLVCATNSYQPKCRYLNASTKNNELILTDDGDLFSGTEKCPFGPDQTGVSLYTGKSLYSATVSEFSGRSYTITRSLGEEKQLRTPKFDPKFLYQPYFVKMVDDGERVLIFMNEMVQTENGDARMVAYVAQVCKNDVGGTHVLVRQWTKFEKTRLNCSVNGFYFDQLKDVSDPMDVRVNSDSDTTVKTIYATFTTPDYSVPGSAVCAFPVDAIHDALIGRFRDERGSSGSKSSAPSGSKHPGRCPSRQYTESELLFLKSHPLLEDQARGNLLTTQVGERWSSITVDSAAGPNRNWTIYFVGTTTGQVLRYLSPTGGLKNSALLRRQDVYDEERCGNASEEDKSVTRIFADPERNQILVTFKHCVVSVPLRSCNIHTCKKSCVASADPYCGWNGTDCVDYVSHSVNVEQYVFTKAAHPVSNVDDLCPKSEILPIPVDKPENKAETATTDKQKATSNGEGGKKESPDFTITNGTFVSSHKGKDGAIPLPRDAKVKTGSIEWPIVIGIAGGCAVLFFIMGFIASKKCCGPTKKDIEKQPEGMEMSKTSVSNPETLCKKFIASISPNRPRKQSLKAPSLNHSQSNLADPQGEPLVAKDHSKQDELVKNAPFTSGNTLPLPERNHKSRLNSTSSASQVTMTESVASFNSKRRSSNQPTSSTSSMSKTRPYATAPRTRHYSGNRTSDPSDYSNASTLRADRSHSRMQSRYSTPVPANPTTPTSLNDFPMFKFDTVVERTDHVLDGVKEVIEREQRRSAEMEPVIEESEEARLRHDSSDSGKGSSPRNSVQTEDQDKLSTLSRSRPENITIGQPRGRKRLNSEPTSPTMSQPPLPPPSSHKPVSRSTSMRSQHAMSVPHYQSRKRSESFSHQSNPGVPVVNGSPLKMQQMVQGGFHPKAQPNTYSTLPLKPQMIANGHPPQMDRFNRQQSYDTYSPHKPYAIFDQMDHPAMNLPDRFSSLPLRGHAHRSNKKSYPPQYAPPQPAQSSRRNSAAPQIPSTFHKQMSSPATFETQRAPRFVPTPTVPGYPVTLPEQDAV